MKTVMITLGEKAEEFVAGIPEEELSEILSDILERSLESQMGDVIIDSNNTNYLLSQIKQMFDEVSVVSPVSTNKSIDIEDSVLDIKKAKVNIVESSAPLKLEGDFDDFDFMK